MWDERGTGTPKAFVDFDTNASIKYFHFLNCWIQTHEPKHKHYRKVHSAPNEQNCFWLYNIDDETLCTCTIRPYWKHNVGNRPHSLTRQTTAAIPKFNCAERIWCASPPRAFMKHITALSLDMTRGRSTWNSKEEKRETTCESNRKEYMTTER